MRNHVPPLRVTPRNSAPVNPQGAYVLYWMIAARRPHWNFGLQRAASWAEELNRPLLVFEPLRAGYRWASDRIHAFVLGGMAAQAQHFARRRVTYYAYAEPEPGAGKGLLERLADDACVVVTDDFPAFFLPRMVAAAAEKLKVALEAVDSNGLLPLRAADKAYATAYSFRRFLQQTLPAHLLQAPLPDPLRENGLPGPAVLPADIPARWPAVGPGLLKAGTEALKDLPIDHRVPKTQRQGGCIAAAQRLKDFVAHDLARYAEGRNHPDHDVTSGLSPYLHFGHISVHQVFETVAAEENWFPGQLAERATGKRQGWWGMRATAEAFLDELVTWREVGYNMCAHKPDYADYGSLPDWARKTLADHAADKRAYIYSLAELEASQTHDALWNAAQRELRQEGRIHNYLRMVWGKKILEWSPAPQEALARMLELNNRYALDGRDPNSYSGIFWVLGRYDRPWGPVRPVFGTVRYMSSASTLRKVKVQHYLETYGGPE